MDVVKTPIVEVRLYNERTVLLTNVETSPPERSFCFAHFVEFVVLAKG